jgi:hypothetical protein
LIVKELDPFSSSDKFQIAGRKAEEQMAHYLRRFFGSSADVDVLNYLRIELGGEVAQMDHLVLHPYGLLIVESKSVSGSVQIKDDGQWIRWFAKQPQGMRSPVTQAKMKHCCHDLVEVLLPNERRRARPDRPKHPRQATRDSQVANWPMAAHDDLECFGVSASNSVGKRCVIRPRLFLRRGVTSQ